MSKEADELMRAERELDKVRDERDALFATLQRIHERFERMKKDACLPAKSETLDRMLTPAELEIIQDELGLDLTAHERGALLRWQADGGGCGGVVKEGEQRYAGVEKERM